MQQKPPFDLNDFRPSSFSLAPWRFIVPGIILLVLITSSFITIDTDEVGVVLRFGKFNRELEPGLRFKLPIGIESVERVAVRRQLKQEFGFRTDRAGTRTSYSTASFDDESLMLTGDLNIADVEWSVQYRVKNAYQYLFRVRSADETFRDMNEAVMRGAVGDRTISEVLNSRTEIEVATKDWLQELCDQYELGLDVTQIQLQAVTVPDPVKPAFNKVNAAEQEKEQTINEAQGEFNRVIPKARGEAARTIEEAKGYALERVNRAKGDAASFNALYAEYRKAKEVTRQRIYLETLNEVLQKVGNKLIMDEDAASVLPFLDLKAGGKK